MTYLHSSSPLLVHKDLNPSNVLLFGHKFDLHGTPHYLGLRYTQHTHTIPRAPHLLAFFGWLTVPPPTHTREQSKDHESGRQPRLGQRVGGPRTQLRPHAGSGTLVRFDASSFLPITAF